eukprot:COSAG01_NODE_12209_length_1779_cov_5.569643_2_plen_165_part_00
MRSRKRRAKPGARWRCMVSTDQRWRAMTRSGISRLSSRSCTLGRQCVYPMAPAAICFTITHWPGPNIHVIPTATRRRRARSLQLLPSLAAVAATHMRWDGDGHTLAQRLPAEELTADLSAVHLQPVPAPRLQTHGTQCRLPHAHARTHARTHTMQRRIGDSRSS